MTSAKVKQIAINIGFIILAFTVQNCVFPLLPFLAATPNLLLILTFSFGFIHGKNAGMFYGVISGLLLDLFYSGSFGFYTLIYIYIGYFNGIFTRYYYEDLIVRGSGNGIYKYTCSTTDRLPHSGLKAG